jgi:hypothetical protein
MKSNIYICIIVAFVLFVCFKIYADKNVYNLKCIISNVDGKKYCVREREKLNEAADLLANVVKKCKELVAYMKNKYSTDERVIKLYKGFNPDKISETLPTSELTAYSENKGEKIALCLNKTKNGTELIDPDTLTFVAIHELAHIMTTSIGHKQEFWQNFKFLLENAKEANIHQPVDYSKKSQSYCGINITDSPYYGI